MLSHNHIQDGKTGASGVSRSNACRGFSIVTGGSLGGVVGSTLERAGQMGILKDGVFLRECMRGA